MKATTRMDKRFLGMLVLGLGLSTGALADADGVTALPSGVPSAWRAPGDERDRPVGQVDPADWFAIATGSDQPLAALLERGLQRHDAAVAADIQVRAHALDAEAAEHGLWPAASASASVSRSLPLRHDGSAVTTRELSAQVGYSRNLHPGVASQAVDRAAIAADEAAVQLEAARWDAISNVTQQYWLIAAIDEKLVMAAASIRDAELTLKATEARVASGAALRRSRDTALAALDAARSRQTQLRVDRLSAEMALAVATADWPEAFRLASANLPRGLPPDVNADVPASVLDARPGVRLARLSLDRAALEARLAAAQWYPQFTVSTALGTSAATLATLWRAPFALVGLDLSLPFLDPRKVELDVRRSKLGVDAAAIEFARSLRQALLDVEQLLLERQRLLEDHRAVAVQWAEARRIQAAARIRFETGASSLQTVRDADAAVYAQEFFLVDLRQALWVNFVKTCQSIGARPAPTARDATG